MPMWHRMILRDSKILCKEDGFYVYSAGKERDRTGIIGIC